MEHRNRWPKLRQQSCVAAFQSDGNFVIYNGSTPIWTSQTGGNPGAKLVFSSQLPHLQIMTAGGSIVWANFYTFSPGNFSLDQEEYIEFGPLEFEML